MIRIITNNEETDMSKSETAKCFVILTKECLALKWQLMHTRLKTNLKQ